MNDDASANQSQAAGDPLQQWPQELTRIEDVRVPDRSTVPGSWQLRRETFGVAAGADHNFMSLWFVPADGRSPQFVSEIHGMSEDRRSRKFGAMALGTDHDLTGARNDTGRPWARSVGTPVKRSSVLAQGDYDDIVNGYWTQAQREAREFNKRAVVYKFDEQNSNNFARNLMARIGLGARSGKWDGNWADYGAHGFAYNPGQWHTGNVFDESAITRSNMENELWQRRKEWDENRLSVQHPA